MAVPLMDNCCSCTGDDCFDEKCITGKKTWGGLFPFPTPRLGSWGESVDVPTLVEDPDNPGNWSQSPTPLYPCGTDGLPLAEDALGGDPNEAVIYRTATLTVTVWGYYAEDYAPGWVINVWVPITYVLVTTWDRRDGYVVFQSITLTPDPVVYGHEGYTVDVPFLGRGSASMTVGDDGTITWTGDTWWRDNGGIPVVSVGGVLTGHVGFWRTSWSVVVARTAATFSMTFWVQTNTTGPGDFVLYTETATIVLTDEYQVGTALDDTLWLLEQVTFDDWLLPFHSALVVWDRHLAPITGWPGAMSIHVTISAGVPLDNYGQAALGVFLDSDLTFLARKSWYRDTCFDGIRLCDVHADGQYLMVPSTIYSYSDPSVYNGHGVVAGPSGDLVGVLADGGTYEFTYLWVQRACGVKYGVALVVSCTLETALETDRTVADIDRRKL